MYFQVCSNSAYPQHSGERYRTNGPLVLNSVPYILFCLILTDDAQACLKCPRGRMVVYRDRDR